MHSIESVARAIVAREGGYVNDPDDPGGATKYGVTIGTARALGLDLDGDGRVTVADIRALTPDLAVRVYIDHYFRAPRIDLLPAPLQTSVMDMQVNAGRNAGKILQSLLNRLTGANLVVDGVIGARTAMAAAQAMARYPDLPSLYSVDRRRYYYRLGDLRPASRKYARRRDGGKGGWITRAEEFMAPNYRLTEAQHRARVARWV